MPTRQMDFELELGFVVGTGNTQGSPVSCADAPKHVFGVVLLNDWSARDVQKWEYQPLGPFLAKNFHTSISPWIVELAALEPFRCAGRPQDPPPLEYLTSSRDSLFDIGLEVWLKPEGSDAPERICATNYRGMYWDFQQQLAHHTVNGCAMRPGDLFATGTISGSDPGTYGSLLELSWGGKQPVQLSGGKTRSFLEDGDEVIIRGLAARGDIRVGFGEMRTKVLPARK
jgi:fumarylacetoacetase